MVASSTALRIVASSGAETVLAPTLHGATVTASLPALGDGVYKVYWKTVSADDLHAVADQLVFAVGGAAPAPAATGAGDPPEPTPRLLEVLARWLSFGALALLCGLAALRSGATGRGGAPLFHLTALALIAHGGFLAVQVSAVGGFNVLGRVLGSTGFGHGWILRAVLIVAAGALCAVGRMRDGAIAAALAAAAGALGSHAAALGVLPEAVMAIHLAAAATWAGIVVAAAWKVVPRLRTDPEARTTLVRLGWIAGPAMALIVVTGIYSAGRHVATVDALVTTVYGAAILTKVGLLALAAAVAFVSNRLLRTDGRTGQLLRTVPIEAVVLALVLIPASVLAAGSPARGARFGPPVPPPAASITETRPIDDLLVSFTAKPNRPGTNFLTIRVLNTRRPARAPIAAVTVTITEPAAPPRTIAARKVVGDDWEVPDATFSRPDALRLTATVTRTGIANAVAAVPWQVGGAAAAPRKAVTLSRQALGPVLIPLAGALALALTVGGALYLLRRRRGTMVTPNARLE